MKERNVARCQIVNYLLLKCELVAMTYKQVSPETHSPLYRTFKGTDGKQHTVPLCEYIKALSEGYLGLFVLGLPE